MPNASLHQLEKKRLRLGRELEKLGEDDSRRRAIFLEVCRLADEINARHEEEAIEDAREAIPAFRKFLVLGCKHDDFTTRVYESLHGLFGFIAWYNRDGFYESHFRTRRSTVETLSYMLSRDTTILEDAPTFRKLRFELEREFQEAIESSGILPKLRRELDHELMAFEKAELVRLLDKYGLPEDYRL